MLNPRSFLFTTALALYGCSAGQSDASITGLVVDYAGHPLAGATVSIKKSAYTATSGPDGRYIIPFAPGTFNVVYEKDGMTTVSVEHNIQGELEFPAADIHLFPIPSEAGVYFLGDNGPVKLRPAEMDKHSLSNRIYFSEYKYFCTEEGTVSVPQGEIRFIDTSPAAMLPVKVGGYGLVLHENGGETSYNGVFKDTKEYVGEGKLVVRSFDAKPGNYAFVTFSNKAGGKRQLDISAGCLPFKVK